MIANVAKWGNSLAVRIPVDAARQLQIADGVQLDLKIEDGALVLRPRANLPRYELDQLLAQITPENLHVETSTGQVVGHES